MMSTTKPKRTLGAFLLAALCAALAACMLVPGKFTSSLDIRRDGTFAFAYAGEISVLALSQIAQSDRGKSAFRPTPCYTDDGSRERPCSADELAAQRKSWQEADGSSTDSRRQERESMKAMLGGLDLEDPRAAEELAARMRAQAGWRRAEYRGNGVFDVDFAINGRLTHDFTFPTVERFPLANGFVEISLRRDGAVRVDAPGFGPSAQGSAFAGMMSGAARMGSTKDPKAQPLPSADGIFVLRTDGEILANNTDNGPEAGPAGKQMSWRVDAGTTAAPKALIRLN